MGEIYGDMSGTYADLVSVAPKLRDTSMLHSIWDTTPGRLSPFKWKVWWEDAHSAWAHHGIYTEEMLEADTAVGWLIVEQATRGMLIGDVPRGCMLRTCASRFRDDFRDSLQLFVRADAWVRRAVGEIEGVTMLPTIAPQPLIGTVTFDEGEEDDEDDDDIWSTVASVPATARPYVYIDELSPVWRGLVSDWAEKYGDLVGVEPKSIVISTGRAFGKSTWLREMVETPDVAEGRDRWARKLAAEAFDVPEELLP